MLLLGGIIVEGKVGLAGSTNIYNVITGKIGTPSFHEILVVLILVYIL